MAQWKIINKTSKEPVSKLYDTKAAAQAIYDQMGKALREHVELVPDTSDAREYRILTEGLVAGDLRRIVLPIISIDEYVPADASTNNIVIAFFIKNIQESVIPFRNFLQQTKGVVGVEYGTSDTISNATVVYAEMVRDKFEVRDLDWIVEQVGILCGMDPEDFTMTFPVIHQYIPYNPDVVQKYFDSRSEKMNQMAQQDAIDNDSDDQDSGNGSQVKVPGNESVSDDDLTRYIAESFLEG